MVELITGVVAIYNVRLSTQPAKFNVNEFSVRLPVPSRSAPQYRWISSKIALPSVIRVGLGCKLSRCASLTYLDLEDYTRRVLAAEWPATAVRQNVNEALKAGAVAVRSYGLAYIAQPYICTTEACQVLNGRTFVQTDVAVQETKGIVLVDGNSVARAEYAAETNNMGCGDGFTGEGNKLSPCISGTCVCGPPRKRTWPGDVPERLCALGDWRRRHRARTQELDLDSQSLLPYIQAGGVAMRPQ
jgi:hypothetical protein